MLSIASQVFEAIRHVIVLSAQLLVATIMTGIGLILIAGGRFEGLIPLSLGLFAFFNFSRSVWRYFTW